MALELLINLSLQTNDIGETEQIITNYLLILCGVILLALIPRRLFYFFEMFYVEYINKKLFVNHVYLRKRKLSKDQKSILRNNFKFYQRLSSGNQSNFEHRVYQVIKIKEFIGKGIDVSEEMRIIVAATLVKLTFGLRDYNIKSVERILFYPEAFFSQTNQVFHKGEFNLGLKALVFSWKDVVHGYEIEDDNLNLAIHEFTHAIHFYYMSVRRRSTSSAIFLLAFDELTTMLDEDSELKSKLVDAKFLRDYAYTNQFEFIAVIVETFIETPKEFKQKFPRIYNKTREMLNFYFSGY